MDSIIKTSYLEPGNQLYHFPWFESKLFCLEATVSETEMW